MAAENGNQVDHEAGRGIRDQIERYRTAFLAVVVMIVIAAAAPATSSPTSACRCPRGCRSSATNHSR